MLSVAKKVRAQKMQKKNKIKTTLQQNSYQLMPANQLLMVQLYCELERLFKQGYHFPDRKNLTFPEEMADKMSNKCTFINTK